MMLLWQTGSPLAQVLSADQLQSRHDKSLVFFQDPLDTEKRYKGYGVVVSSKGHVLTVAHVVRLFGKADIQGSVGRPTNEIRKLTVVVGKDQIGSKEPSLVLLQFTDETGNPAPLAAMDVMATGVNLRVLTGARTGDETSVIPVSVNARAKKLWQCSGAVDTGYSGSPLFDYFGYVVGFVEQGAAFASTFNAQSVADIKQWIQEFTVLQKSPATPRFKIYVSSVQDPYKDQLSDYRENLLPQFHRLSESLQVERDFDEQHRDSQLFQQLFRALHSGLSDSQKLIDAQKVLADPKNKTELESLGSGRLYLLFLQLMYLKLENLSEKGQIKVSSVMVQLDYDGVNPVLTLWPKFGAENFDISKVTEVSKKVATTILEKLAKREEKFTRDVVFVDCIDDSKTGLGVGPIITLKLHRALEEYWKNPAQTPFHSYKGKIKRSETCDMSSEDRKADNDDPYLYSLARESINTKLLSAGSGSYKTWWRKRVIFGQAPQPSDGRTVTADEVKSGKFLNDWVQDITAEWWEPTQ
jgi:hypothetical protein